MFLLGSANFGNQYTIDKVKLNAIDIQKILHTFNKYGGVLIDTAANYGDAENILSGYNNLKIGTKIPSKVLCSFSKTKETLRAIREKFKNSQLEYVLLHDIENLKFISFDAQNYLFKFVQENNIKFGISVYFFDEIKKAKLAIDFISIVQVPLNYFDRRFTQSNFIRFCKKNQISIQYRSIFLQGNLLKNKEDLNKIFYHKFSPFYHDYYYNGFKNLLSMNLYFISQFSNFSNVIIGVNTDDQLKEIFNTIEDIKLNRGNYEFSNISFDKSLCIPMNWKVK